MYGHDLQRVRFYDTEHCLNDKGFNLSIRNSLLQETNRFIYYSKTFAVNELITMSIMPDKTRVLLLLLFCITVINGQTKDELLEYLAEDKCETLGVRFGII